MQFRSLMHPHTPSQKAGCASSSSYLGLAIRFSLVTESWFESWENTCYAFTDRKSRVRKFYNIKCICGIHTHNSPKQQRQRQQKGCVQCKTANHWLCALLSAVLRPRNYEGYVLFLVYPFCLVLTIQRIEPQAPC